MEVVGVILALNPLNNQSLKFQVLKIKNKKREKFKILLN